MIQNTPLHISQWASYAQKNLNLYSIRGYKLLAESVEINEQEELLLKVSYWSGINFSSALGIQKSFREQDLENAAERCLTDLKNTLNNQNFIQTLSDDTGAVLLVIDGVVVVAVPTLAAAVAAASAAAAVGSEFAYAAAATLATSSTSAEAATALAALVEFTAVASAEAAAAASSMAFATALPITALAVASLATVNALQKWEHMYFRLSDGFYVGKTKDEVKARFALASDLLPPFL